MDGPFAWASALGVSVGIFLAYGALCLGVGVLVHFLVPASPVERFELFSDRPDRALFGDAALSPETARAAGLHRAAMWWWHGGTLVALGVLVVAVAWFGLRAREPWALPALAVAGLATVPATVAITRLYVAAGVVPRLAESPPLLWFPAAAIPVAIVLGWIGLRA